MAETYEGTATKVSPDDPRFDLERPRSRKLKKGPIVLLVAGVGLLLVMTLYLALQPKSVASVEPHHATIDPDFVKRSMPDSLRLTASDYAQADQPEEAPPKLGAPLQGDLGAFQLNQPAPPAVPAYQPPPAPKQSSAEELERQRQEQLAREARAKALNASIFFADGGQGSASLPNRILPASATGLPAQLPTGNAGQALSADYGGDANWQQQKQTFLGQNQRDKAYLADQLQAPRSPYEVKAGSIIPAVLITGINSDLPGQIIAQVREQVYDTVAGRYLLIPQGTRVLGRYDSGVSYGQERALVVWTRLIFPDGSSIDLEGMPGVDLSGQAGYSDEVNNHWGRVAGGVVLSSLLAGTAGYESDQDGFQGQFYENVGMEVNRAGQRITRKNLNIQPTIEIRPGYSINILVNRDMVLKPLPLDPPDPLDAALSQQLTNQGAY